MGARRKVLLLAGALLLIGLGGALLYGRRGEAASVAIAGMVRQTEIRIAPEITGRLAAIPVSPGQPVRKGDLVATLDTPELAASVAEARAAVASARAERDRVHSGVRAEEVAIAAQAVRTAQANLLLAQQHNDRAVALSARSFTSRQQLDESNASLAKAHADLDLKQAQSTAAQAGPIAEERALADTKVALAEAALADVQARLDKTRLTAPADGTIGIRVAEPGEIIAPGKPVATLLVAGGYWFGFTLREDYLRGLALGETTSLTRADGSRLAARVTELRPLGEFATWRAARAVGDHDLNSFRVRLDPVAGSDGLEPGMSLWLQRGP
ncbi:biotin/lipoyl-binding protein [Bosea caraganae]|uniref:Biotin/lipoyl-binding protein n=1 Tax=Bosea caraganae TaxID=2763117 RepID=A0A370LAQ4_9HYPH|nr:HlyD family efflux transporter periplasmic adaptor subunit [Bosea caraganae]RDJ27014.1 biotin/lipoyl-binding protein [Bosea caraganae]RDJ29031.1 biotin/lipoyl-binding protein [Bosea caraganae]